MDNAPQEIHVVSVMTHAPLERRAKVRDEKGDRLLPPSMLRQNRTGGEEHKSSQWSGNKQENSKDKNEIPCRFQFCKNP